VRRNRPDHIRAEMAKFLEEISPGRTSAAEITLFKSLGSLLRNLFAAEYSTEGEGAESWSWVEFEEDFPLSHFSFLIVC